MCKNPHNCRKERTLWAQQDNREPSQKWTLLLNSSLFQHTWICSKPFQSPGQLEKGGQSCVCPGTTIAHHGRQHVRERRHKSCASLAAPALTDLTPPLHDSKRYLLCLLWQPWTNVMKGMWSLEEPCPRNLPLRRFHGDQRGYRGLYTKPPAQLHNLEVPYKLGVRSKFIGHGQNQKLHLCSMFVEAARS